MLTGNYGKDRGGSRVVPARIETHHQKNCGHFIVFHKLSNYSFLDSCYSAVALLLQASVNMISTTEAALLVVAKNMDGENWYTMVS